MVLCTGALRAVISSTVPPDTPWAEAEPKARASGLKLKKGYFHVIKSQLKKARGGGRVGRTRAPIKKSRTGAVRPGLRLVSDHPDEQRLLEAVAVLGLERSRQLIATVRERALGEKVLESITGAQQVVKIVHDALVEMLGGAAAPLAKAERPPTVILLVGLQGSGKTTTAGKLANVLRKRSPVAGVGREGMSLVGIGVGERVDTKSERLQKVRHGTNRLARVPAATR